MSSRRRFGRSAHPARRARWTFGLASSATYVGLTASIGLAVQAEAAETEVDQAESEIATEVLALTDDLFNGGAEPVAAAEATTTSLAILLKRLERAPNAADVPSATTAPERSTSVEVPLATTAPTSPSTTSPTTAVPATTESSAPDGPTESTTTQSSAVPSTIPAPSTTAAPTTPPPTTTPSTTAPSTTQAPTKSTTISGAS